MISLLLVPMLLAQTPGRTSPVAMVLEVQGKVEIMAPRSEIRPLRVQSLLYSQDKLVAGEDAKAIVVFFADGRRERLKAKTEATVGKNGCQPAEAVEVLRAALAPKGASGLASLRSNSKAATQVLRAGPKGENPPVKPIVGTAIWNLRPEFSWPAHPTADGYLLELLGTATGKVIWRASSKEPKLLFPQKEKPLLHNYAYTWRVLAELKDERQQIISGEFYVVTAALAEQLKLMAELARSDALEDLALAAAVLEANRAYEEATAAYERLCKLRPNEPVYRGALATLYEQAGRKEAAKKAWQEAEKLGYVRPAVKGPPL